MAEEILSGTKRGKEVMAGDHRRYYPKGIQAGCPIRKYH